MNTSSIKHRLLLAAVTTAVSTGLILLENKLTPVAKFNLASAKAAAPAQNTIVDTDKTSGAITIRPLSASPDQAARIQLVHITDDPDRIFESTPPSPLDYAVILESLINRGYRRVLLTTRMSWDEKPGLETKGLGSRLALFQQSVISLPVTRGATTQTIPPPLERAVIPLSQVTGNHRLIPRVNQVPLPTHTHGGRHTLAGFHTIESSPTPPGHIPMLAHWENKGLIPSVELLALMMIHGVQPEELDIHCGKHIRIGKNGPVIPLDAYGQTTPPTTPSDNPSPPSPPPLKADNLITEKTDTHLPHLPEICLIHATGSKTNSSNTLDDGRLSNLLSLCHNALLPEQGTKHLRLPLWAELLLILDISLLAAWLSGFTLWNRRLSFALTAALLFPLLAALMANAQLWFGLTAPLFCLAVAFFVPPQKYPRKTSSTGEKYSTTRHQPVIRV